MWVPWGFYWNADLDSKGPGRSLRLCISNKQPPTPGDADAAGSGDHTLWVQGCGGKGSCWEVLWPWSGSLPVEACFAFQNEMLEKWRTSMCSHAIQTWRSCSRAIPQVWVLPQEGRLLPPPTPSRLLTFSKWQGVKRSLYPRAATEHVQRASHEADANLKNFSLSLFGKQRHANHNI